MAASNPEHVESQANSNISTTVAFLGPVNSYSHQVVWDSLDLWHNPSYTYKSDTFWVQATKTAFPGPRWHLEPTGTIKGKRQRPA